MLISTWTTASAPSQVVGMPGYWNFCCVPSSSTCGVWPDLPRVTILTRVLFPRFGNRARMRQARGSGQLTPGSHGLQVEKPENAPRSLVGGTTRSIGLERASPAAPPPWLARADYTDNAQGMQ